MGSESVKNRSFEDGIILTKNGFAVLGKSENESEVDEEVVQEIAKFFEDHPLCPKPKKRKRICNEDFYYLGHSYGLKHIFSRFLKRHYCANGEFIAACIDVGFKVIPISESPNAQIYIPCKHKHRTSHDTSYHIVIYN